MLYFNNFDKNDILKIYEIFNHYKKIDTESLNLTNKLQKNIEENRYLTRDDFYTTILMISSYIYLYKDIQTFDLNELNYISNLLLKFIFFYKDNYCPNISEIDDYVLYSLKNSFNKYKDILNIKNTYNFIFYEILK